MPDVSGASAVNTRVHTPTTKRTRGCGCIGHPAFPAPSDFIGRHCLAKLGRIVPRERGGASEIGASGRAHARQTERTFRLRGISHYPITLYGAPLLCHRPRRITD